MANRRRKGKATRGTSNGNCSGNSYQRRARREWLWDKYSIATIVVGIGQFGKRLIKCHHCPTMMDKDEFQVDRFPLCGHNGGGYTRNNIVPSCAKCNRDRCSFGCGVGVAAPREARA